MDTTAEKKISIISGKNIKAPANAQFSMKGLTDREVIDSRLKSGRNELDNKTENGFLIALKNLFKEPMFLLLLAAATIYFITGKSGDGFFYAVSNRFLSVPFHYSRKQGAGMLWMY